MTLPELMVKVWDGDPDEYFTWIDMNRVEYNANIVARESGVEQVGFLTVSRSSQFRWDEAQKLEDLIAAVALARGIEVTMEDSWGQFRTVSYVDFERWESAIWAIYTDLGGTGERIPAGKVMVTYAATLYANRWKGRGPYHQDLELPGVRTGMEVFVFIPHTATVPQRAQEYNAILRAVPLGDKLARVYALQKKPPMDLPLRFAIGGLEMFEVISLPVAGWEGSGPWTQTVTVESAPVNAVIGQQDGMTDDEVIQMMDAKISVSAVSGDTVTVRAIGRKPTIALNPGLLWEISEVS